MKDFCFRCDKETEFENDGADLICRYCGFEKVAGEKWAKKYGKNTRQGKKLRKSAFGVSFYDDYFTYMGKKYFYSNIKELDPGITNVQHLLNYIPSGKSVDVSLRIRFFTGRSLFFYNYGLKSPSTKYSRPAEQEQIIAIFRTLHKKLQIERQKRRK